MARKYSYVQPCGRCGSTRTGYFVHGGDWSGYGLVHKGLKRGELVRSRQGMKDPSAPNCFCDDCGVEWRGKIQTKRLTAKELQEEFKKRGINLEETLTPKQLQRLDKEKVAEEDNEKVKEKGKKFVSFLGFRPKD